MYNSEAQAYQAIRREWKHKLNHAQRLQTLYKWQVDNSEVHPRVIRAVSEVMGIKLTTMPVDSQAKKIMHQYQDEVSTYSLLLNKYKVNKDL